MGFSPSYEKLKASTDTLTDLDSQMEDDKQPRSEDSRPVWYRSLTMRLVALAGSAALIGFVFIGVCITVLQRHHGGNSVGSSADIMHCGQYAAEARALGCTFDVMLQLWVPPECYDEKMSEGFLSRGQWKWYSDNRGLYEISDETMRRGEAPVAFMVDGYHRQYCVFTWQLMVRALRLQRPLLEEMLSYEHVKHCRKVLHDPTRNATERHTSLSVEAHVGYARCAPYDVWRHNLPADNMLEDVY